MGIASILGAIGGLFIGGPIGGIVGYCIGKMLDGDSDPKLEKLFSSANNKDQISFQMSLLTLMAAVMQANGQTKRCELDYVKEYIRKAFATEEDQRNALQMLKEMLEQKINPEEVAQQVAKQMNIYHKRELIHFLVGIGISDGDLDSNEENLILKITKILGISSTEYYSIKATFTAKSQRQSSYSNQSSSSYSRSGSGSSSRGSSSSSSSGRGSSSDSSSGSKSRSRVTSPSMSLTSAYTILGIASTATDEQVRKAYRSMANKYHPDHVATLGEKVIMESAEKFKQIQKAYDTIKSSRNIK